MNARLAACHTKRLFLCALASLREAAAMLERILEPEVMDSASEATDYDAMDHSQVNQRFVADLQKLLPSPHRGRWAGGEGAVPTLLDVGTGTAQIPIALCQQ